MQPSEALAIEEVGLDEGAGLFVRPALAPSEDFRFIWRTATGIRWSDRLRGLYAAEPGRWSPLELFEEMVKAVRDEYGRSLVVTRDTRWLGVPLDLQTQMQRLLMEAP
jgi:hypothetical protein